ncbi:ribonuclease H-like domain-containing protein [Cytidiella melzeri]|nr:ribonuclease H-like domain-containing protein [Cytidiella melzeri]
MSDSDTERGAGIYGHKLIFCPTAQRMDTRDLINHCDDCGMFFAYCCSHDRDRTNDGQLPCHHYSLVFTDGACLNNGQDGARAGIGGAMGTEEWWQFSLAVDEKVDTLVGAKRTSQRAELLAAIEGVRRMSDVEGMFGERRGSHRNFRDLPGFVVTTDSEYVVKGMTEWLPRWKENHFRTSTGKRPANLDLFRQLNAMVEVAERKHKITIGFWHVGREHNKIADTLAKQGAHSAFGVRDEPPMLDVEPIVLYSF